MAPTTKPQTRELNAAERFLSPYLEAIIPGAKGQREAYEKGESVWGTKGAKEKLQQDLDRKEAERLRKAGEKIDKTYTKGTWGTLKGASNEGIIDANKTIDRENVVDDVRAKISEEGLPEFEGKDDDAKGARSHYRTESKIQKASDQAAVEGVSPDLIKPGMSLADIQEVRRTEKTRRDKAGWQAEADFREGLPSTQRAIELHNSTLERYEQAEERALRTEQRQWRLDKQAAEEAVRKRNHDRDLVILQNENNMAQVQAQNQLYRDKWAHDERLAEEAHQENQIQAIIGGLFSLGGAFAL